LTQQADFFVSSGLSKVGYTYISTDDGWMTGARNAAGQMIPDPVKFPGGGFADVAAYVHAKGLKVGIYSAASSVVCSGRTGSLYHEAVDAAQWAGWGLDCA